MEHKRSDRLFLLIVTLFWFSQYIFVPFLSPHLAALGVTASLSGVILGAYGFAQLVLRVPVSVSEDCIGRHKLFMVGGLVALTLGSALPLLSASPAVYLLSRTLAGVSASPWVSYTVGFTSGTADVKARMGRLIGANNLGVMLSYIVGGALYEHLGMKTLYAISTLVAFAALMLLPLCRVKNAEHPHAFRIRDVLDVLKNRRLLLTSFMGALLQLIVFATAQSFVSSYAKELGVSGVGISLIAIAFNAAGVLASSLFSKGLFSRMSERAFWAMGFAVLALYCLALPVCSGLVLIILAQLVGGAGRTLLYTHQMAVCSADVPAESKTTAMGIYQSIYSLGMTFGPIVMGWFIDGTGSYTASFLLVGAFALAGVVWSWLAGDQKEL